MPAANDNRPKPEPTRTRVPVQSLPMLGRINAASGEVTYTKAPPARLL